MTATSERSRRSRNPSVRGSADEGSWPAWPVTVTRGLAGRPGARRLVDRSCRLLAADPLCYTRGGDLMATRLDRLHRCRHRRCDAHRRSDRRRPARRQQRPGRSDRLQRQGLYRRRQRRRSPRRLPFAATGSCALDPIARSSVSAGHRRRSSMRTAARSCPASTTPTPISWAAVSALERVNLLDAVTLDRHRGRDQGVRGRASRSGLGHRPGLVLPAVPGRAADQPDSRCPRARPSRIHDRPTTGTRRGSTRER